MTIPYTYPNFGAIPPDYASLEKARIVLLPVPYDSTTDYKAGAREGPQAIIAASQHLEFYDPELGRETYKVGIHTLPELEPSMGGPRQTIERVYRVARELVWGGKVVAMLGGEHSLTLGMVRAFKERWPDLSVLQLDAHADLRERYQGTRYSHACVMRRVWELCPVVPVGLRSLSLEEERFLRGRFRPLPPESVSPEEVVSFLSPRVYITIDLDVFDPAIMSAVGTPEPGGMGWHQVLGLLKGVASAREVVGFDLVELCPREGPTSCAYLAAKLAYKVMGYVTASL